MLTSQYVLAHMFTLTSYVFPAGACALQQARCKRSYLRHLKNSLPPPPLPLSPPPPLPLSPPSSAPSVSPLLRSLCLPPPPLPLSPPSSAPSPSNPSCTGQSLPVHVLRSKSVQKRLLVALEPPFPNLPCSLPVHAAAELEAVAASLRETPGITSVTLGRVIGGGALAPGFQIFLASQSDSDYKLVARAGLTIQEVMIFLD
ncbi:unnamed protein product [Closterium sp. NIES-65]|nr:unnamed protein product [Closterium sp. NIES-65]